MRQRMNSPRRATGRRLSLERLELRQMLAVIDFLQQSVNLYSVSHNAIDYGQPVAPIYTDYNAAGVYMSSVYAGGAQLDGNDPNVDSASGGTSSWRMSVNSLGTTAWFQFNLGPNRPRTTQSSATRLSCDSWRRRPAGTAVESQGCRRLAGRRVGNVLGPNVVHRVGSLRDRACPAHVQPSGIDAVQFVLGDGLNQGLGTVRLDEVRLGVEGCDPLRLAQSYRPGGWVDDDPAPPLRSVADRDLNIYPSRAFLYDQALTIKALVAAGDLPTARDVADAILATGAGNGSYFNERTAGHVLNGDGTARDPFSQKQTLGDNAWFGLALIDLYSALKGSAPDQAIVYLDHARAISDWAELFLKDSGVLRGYRGGFDSDGNAVSWRSVEENVDHFQLNRLLAAEYTALGALDAAELTERAQHAGDFVIAMFDDDAGMFWTGTTVADTINTASIPLDVQLWSILTLGQSADYRKAIDWSRPLAWAETHLQTSDGIYVGFTYSSGSTPGIVWFEGTAHAAVLYCVLGQHAKRGDLIQMLDMARDTHPHGDGSGLVAASRDGLVDQAFADVAFDGRLHLGATAWYYFAQRQINPFAPFDTTPPRVTVDRLLTRDRQPPLSGTVDDPAATVQVTVDGTTYAAINRGNGTWALPDDTIQPALADGVYEVLAESVDVVGNVGQDTSSWELSHRRSAVSESEGAVGCQRRRLCVCHRRAARHQLPAASSGRSDAASAQSAAAAIRRHQWRQLHHADRCTARHQPFAGWKRRR